MAPGQMAPPAPRPKTSAAVASRLIGTPALALRLCSSTRKRGLSDASLCRPEASFKISEAKTRIVHHIGSALGMRGVRDKAGEAALAAQRKQNSEQRRQKQAQLAAAWDDA